MDEKLNDLLKSLRDKTNYTRDVEIFTLKGEDSDSLVIEYYPHKSIIEWEKWNVSDEEDVNISITSEKIIDIL